MFSYYLGFFCSGVLSFSPSVIPTCRGVGVRLSQVLALFILAVSLSRVLSVSHVVSGCSVCIAPCLDSSSVCSVSLSTALYFCVPSVQGSICLSGVLSVQCSFVFLVLFILAFSLFRLPSVYHVPSVQGSVGLRSWCSLLSFSSS